MTSLPSLQRGRVSAFAISSGGSENSKPKPNQDVFLASVVETSGVFAVFDGHGPQGAEIAKISRRHLLKILKLILPSMAGTEALRRAFAETETEVLESGIGRLSGSTCSLVLISPGQIVVANLGDSRVVLASKIGNDLFATPLTVDHKPVLPIEQARLRAKGAIVEPSNVNGRFAGPTRIWAPPQVSLFQSQVQTPLHFSPCPSLTSSLNDKLSSSSESHSLNSPAHHSLNPSAFQPLSPSTHQPLNLSTPQPLTPSKFQPRGPGLTMSRSFGDSMGKEIGVSSEPDIYSLPLTQEAAFLILATDGVWDMLSNEEAVEIVAKVITEGGPKEAAKALVKEAVERWEEVDLTECIELCRRCDCNRRFVSVIVVEKI